MVDSYQLDPASRNGLGKPTLAELARMLSESPLAPILGLSADGVAIFDPGSARLLYANASLGMWLDRPPGELIGEQVDCLLEVDLPGSLSQQLATIGDGTSNDGRFSARLLAAQAAWPAEVRLTRLEWNGRPLVGIVVHRVAPPAVLNSTVTGQRNDPLTGVADRAFLFARLEGLLHGDRTVDRQFAVLFIDLNNFKEVNDTHGHLVGDRVLREVALRLTSCVRTCDHVARYGGDEFVVLLERVSGWDEIAPVVDRIHAALKHSIALDQGEVVLSVSIGVAEASPGHQSPEDLLAEADRAMYAAKRAGE
jgi:diguanylate cyclase (GGDEF)-like protein